MDPSALKKWIVFVVPAVALCELALHFKQVSSVVPDDDWMRAKAEVEKKAKPDELVAFAPQWVDPIGREKFGPSIATFEREAYPDVTRFPRAIEVGIRGEHLADLAGRVAPGEGSPPSDYRPLFHLLKAGAYSGTMSVEAVGFEPAMFGRVLEFIKAQWDQA